MGLYNGLKYFLREYFNCYELVFSRDKVQLWHIQIQTLSPEENSPFPVFFVCNRLNSFLSFGGSQLYNSEALPFTYDQYVVIELADKLYNSVTDCFLYESTNFHPDILLFQVAVAGD